MKKLFTTFLMMGVALCGWATITETSSGNTVTLNYVADGSSDDQNFTLSNRNATTIELTGDWANKDLQKIGSIVGQCSGNVFLDLSACSNMACQVKYTGEGDTDWTSNDFEFTYSYGDPVATPVEKKNGEWGYYTEYYYYPTQPNPNSWTTIDESLVTPTGDYTGTAMIKPSGSKFSLAGGDFSNQTGKLSGIAFPDHKDFTAIPDNVFGDSGGPAGLTSATVGSNLLYIGEHAFKNTQLASFNFPTALKVIAPEAFDKCKLTTVDLEGCTSLAKIGYEAFEFCYDLATIKFPDSDKLTYIGNDAFKEAKKVVTIDMSMCGGIQYFYSNGSNYKQFYGCEKLETLILPPNLRIFPGGDENSSIIAKCSKLSTVTFTGTGNATYDSNGDLISGLVIDKNAFDNLTSLTTVTFSSKLAVIDEAAFNKCTNLTTVTMNGQAVYDNNCNVLNPVVINKQAFFGNTKLTNLTLSDNLTYIGVEAFDQTSSLQVVHIPAAVQTIGYKAFNECPALTTVYFDDTTCPNCDKVDPDKMPSMTIEESAFMNAQSIADVYIDNRTPITCTNKAFAFDVTFGQSNPTNPMASLHYPKGQEGHYTNLSHLLDDETARNPGKFQTWLVDHFAYAQEPPSRNGWHEFVTSAPSTTGPDDPKPTGGVILCTYSDVQYAHLVPTGVKAFIVNGVKKTADGNNYELSLEPIQVIPAKTGVILYGEPNAIASDGTPYLSLTPVQFKEGEGQPLRRDYWTDLTEGQEHLKNYLLPTSDDDGNAIVIGPTDKVNGKITFRNFAMNRYSATATLKDYYPVSSDNDVANDFMGFFRCIRGTFTTGRAYLHLSAIEDSNLGLKEEFTEATGGEIIVNMYEDYQLEYELGDQNAKTYNGYDRGFWHNAVWANPKPNWGNRATAFGNNTQPHFAYRGEIDEEADGVVTLSVSEDNSQNGDFYTLQGVKVSNPAKGVYIRNGKKVIIK